MHATLNSQLSPCAVLLSIRTQWIAPMMHSTEAGNVCRNTTGCGIIVLPFTRGYGKCHETHNRFPLLHQAQIMYSLRLLAWPNLARRIAELPFEYFSKIRHLDYEFLLNGVRWPQRRFTQQDDFFMPLSNRTVVPEPNCGGSKMSRQTTDIEVGS